MPHPFLDVRIVDAHVVGIVDEQRGGAVRDGGLQCLDGRIAILLEIERDHLEAGSGGGRGIAGMRLDRSDDLVALAEFAARSVIGAGHHAIGVGRIGAAARLENELIHAGQFAQDQVEFVDDLQDALQRIVGLQRMHIGHQAARPPARPLRGLYFIVQVPKRLMFIMPWVSWTDRR